MTELDRRDRVPPQLARGLEPAMAGDDLVLVIDQEWDVEPKRLDALSNVVDLLIALDLGFRGSDFRDAVRR